MGLIGEQMFDVGGRRVQLAGCTLHPSYPICYWFIYVVHQPSQGQSLVSKSAKSGLECRKYVSQARVEFQEVPQPSWKRIQKAHQLSPDWNPRGKSANPGTEITSDNPGSEFRKYVNQVRVGIQKVHRPSQGGNPVSLSANPETESSKYVSHAGSESRKYVRQGRVGVQGIHQPNQGENQESTSVTSEWDFRKYIS